MKVESWNLGCKIPQTNLYIATQSPCGHWAAEGYVEIFDTSEIGPWHTFRLRVADTPRTEEVKVRGWFRDVTDTRSMAQSARWFCDERGEEDAPTTTPTRITAPTTGAGIDEPHATTMVGLLVAPLRR
jgi:hypothetical protein